MAQILQDLKEAKQCATYYENTLAKAREAGFDSVTQAINEAVKARQATITPEGEQKAAILRIKKAVYVNDTDTLASLTPDSEKIWSTAGSWTGGASVTLGDLRAIARIVVNGGKDVAEMDRLVASHSSRIQIK